MDASWRSCAVGWAASLHLCPGATTTASRAPGDDDYSRGRWLANERGADSQPTRNAGRLVSALAQRLHTDLLPWHQRQLRAVGRASGEVALARRLWRVTLRFFWARPERGQSGDVWHSRAPGCDGGHRVSAPARRCEYGAAGYPWQLAWRDHRGDGCGGAS